MPESSPGFPRHRGQTTIPDTVTASRKSLDTPGSGGLGNPAGPLDFPTRGWEIGSIQNRLRMPARLGSRANEYPR